MLQLEYYPQLYLSEGINRDKLEKLKKELLDTPQKAGVYLLTLARNEKDQLDIYESKYLERKYDKRDFSCLIIGIAEDYEKAVGIVEQIVKETWAARGDAQLREYLMERLSSGMENTDVESVINHT